MKLNFESHYQERVLLVRFDESTVLRSREDVLQWKSEWLLALKTWHSPYKALVDCSNLTIETEALQLELARFFTLLKGLFLQKILGVGFAAENGHAWLPFQVLDDEEDAYVQIGMRRARVRLSEDFRSLLQFDNHFQTHTMELRFLDPVTIDSAEKIQILKDKLLANLRLWHSHWNLLIDCQQLQIEASQDEAWANLMKFFKGFFLKELVGYNKKPDQRLPFRGFRARHRAAAVLESEGIFSGAEANCQSRKKT